ncbi:hypothetical protein RHMOL_Rhmol01G0126800 [Rhododendron molle]|uniref:Uncharacterized protein n=1 Tax=Rhododendron molle TaxID=49168 RepID=A0ACC0Q3G6_RHOML|nr:hypothetical protein RHMOL_Rhmol01G0126800 [Rhododendron molle]
MLSISSSSQVFMVDLIHCPTFSIPQCYGYLQGSVVTVTPTPSTFGITDAVLRMLLNPTEFFANIVVEHEYVECTATAIQAFVLFMKLYPRHCKKEIEAFIVNAVRYLEDIQMPDGSWYGNWGVCFTYGTWFALGGLAAAGKTYSNCAAVRKGVQFLLSVQRQSWGESYLSSPLKKYVLLEDNRSNLVHTSWAMMGLISFRSDPCTKLVCDILDIVTRLTSTSHCQVANQFTNGNWRIPPTGNNWRILEELHATLCSLQEYIPAMGACRVSKHGQIIE